MRRAQVLAFAAVLAALTPGCGLLLGAGGDDAPGPRDGGSDGAAAVDGSPSDGSPGDASGTDGGTGARRCGTTSAVRETFDGEPVHGYLYEDEPPMVTTAGELVITPRSGIGGSTFAGYESTFSLDLRGDAVSIHAIEVPTSSPQASYAYFSFGADGEHEVRFETDGVELAALARDGGDDPAPVTMPFDPETHAFWRIREEAGIVHWEVSRDGVAYTSFRATPLATWWLAAGTIGLGAGTWASTTVSGSAVFDDLNAGQPDIPYCDVDSVRDELETTDGTMWETPVQTGCVVRPVPGGHQIAAEPMSVCTFRTHSGYVVGGHSLTFDLRIPDPDATGVDIVLLDASFTWRVVMGHRSGYFWYQVESDDRTATASDPGTRWRIIVEASRVVFLAVPTGSRDFVTIGEIPLASALPPLRVSLEVRAESSPASADVLGYNLP